MRNPLATHPASPVLLAATLCLALLAPTACNDTPDATPPPTTPPSSTPPTPTPSKPAPPTLPPSAKGLTPQSADSFTRFYLRLLDYTKASRDIGPLRSWSNRGCIGCNELIRGYSHDFSKGGSYAGDFSIKGVTVTGIRLNGLRAAEIKFHANVGRHTVTPHAGAKPVVYPGETIRWIFTLASRNGQWLMYEIEDEAG